MTRDLRLNVLRVFSILAIILIRLTTVYENTNTVEIEDFATWGVVIVNRSLFWSVPILFMISGALLLNVHNESMTIFYKKRISKVLVPTLFWSTFFLSYLYFFENYTFFNVLGVFIRFGGADHLWFMYAIIGLYIFIPYLRILICNISEAELRNLIITIFIFTIGNSYLSQYFANQGTIISSFISYLGYLLLGHYLYKNKNNFKKYATFYGVLSLFIIIGSSVLDIIREYYFHINIPIFLALLPIQAIVLYLYILSTDFNFKLPSLWGHLSIVSFGVYLVHPIFILLFEGYLTMDYFEFLPLFFLLILVGSYILVYVLSKIKFLKSIV